MEDLIKFQKVEFKINSGYYFNEGFNNTITKEIEYLFNKRKELKKQGNKCEVLYKLLMNSSYGKSIQKAHNKGVKFFNNKKDFNKYYDKYYNEMMRAFNYDDEIGMAFGWTICEMATHTHCDVDWSDKSSFVKMVFKLPTYTQFYQIHHFNFKVITFFVKVWPCTFITTFNHHKNINICLDHHIGIF